MPDERIITVLDNLTSLIISHAGMTAKEQYCPSPSPDCSDEQIKEHQKWVRELRDIRQRVENLVTGIIEPDEQEFTATEKFEIREMIRQKRSNSIQERTCGPELPDYPSYF